MQHDDVALEADDLFRNPALGILAVEEDVEQRVDGSQFGEEQEGHHRRAADGQPEPNLVAPSKLHQADEVFHVFERCRGREDPESFHASSELVDERRCSGGGVCTMIGP